MDAGLKKHVTCSKEYDMKTALSALALAAALAAGAAQAADLPSRKGPPPAYIPPPPVMTWNGFYAGLNVGASWQDATSSNVLHPVWGWGTNAGGGPLGVSGGGQVGYNYQLTPMFVVGVETDFQGSSIGTGTNTGVWGGAVNTASINWFGTVRGRLGVSVLSPSLLIYGTGGFAYGEVSRNSWWNQNSTVQTGWTAGGGAEWMFLPNWSVKAEYLYTEISGSNNNGFNGGWNLNNVNNRTRFHTVRAGVNYHFNWGSPAPVLAAY